MANTYVPSGQIAVTAALINAVTGDEAGNLAPDFDAYTLLFAAAAVLPTTAQISGYLKGSPVCAAGDWLLAHGSDPFSGMGDAGYSSGLTVAGKKIKAIVIWNRDSTNTITVSRKAGNPCPIFNADGDAVTLPANGLLVLTFPVGTAALTTGTNDGLTIAVGGGTPIADVLVVYGT